MAAMLDQGQDFLGHLCQSQVPVVPESLGVLLPGDSAPGLPIRPFSCVDTGIAGSSICVNNNNNSCLNQACPFLCVVLSVIRGSEQNVVGAAQRRRQRRLRSWLRHERMTVAMALAESTHHSSRGQKTARAGVWGREMNYTATIRDPPTPQPELFSLYEEPGGVRPDWLSEVRPQDRDQIVDAVPGLPALGVPVPQMVDQPLVLLAAFDVLVPEQVIEVPKLLTPARCPRTVLSMPQTAEQLVEAPNVVSLIDVIRHPVEQTVGGGRIGGLPGFLPGQSYSLSAEQIVDNPVPRRGFGGGLLGFHAGQNSTAFGEADHRATPRGAPHDFH